MSEKKIDFPQDKKKGFLKIILLFFVSLLLLLVVMAGVLQFPAVQTLVVQKLSNYLSKKTGFVVLVEKVNLRWFDTLSLQELKVYDQQDSLMIHVEETFVDFSVLSLLNKQNPSLDEIVLNRPRVQLIKNMPDSGLNITALIRNIRNLLPEQKKGEKKYVPFSIYDVTVHDGTFIYNDPFKDSLEGIFDYNHIFLNQINGQLEAFRIIADTIEFDVKELNSKAPRYNFSVDSLATFFMFTEQSMVFDNLALKAGETRIMDSLAFNYRSMESLEYFVDSVEISARLKGTVVHAQDLAVFAPYFKDYHEVYFLSGLFDGTVSDFEAEDIDVRFGQSHFKGYIAIDGLPNFRESFIEAELENSQLYPSDLKKHFSPLLYENLEKLGIIRFSSQFLGFPNDFVANGEFFTRLGYIKSDINLKLNESKQDLSTYSGTLDLQNFAIGRLLNEPDLQYVSMKGQVSGSGFNFDAAKLKLNAHISQLGYRGYNYQNIRTNGKLARSFFEGALAIKDPNLQISGKGSIDFRNNKQEIKIQANIDTAFLKPLNILEEETFIQARVNVNLRGLDIDEVQGEIFLANAFLSFENRDLSLDTLSLFTSIDSTGRQLMVETNFADLYAAGNFDYSTLAKDLQRLYEEYALNFRNNSEEIEDYYSRKRQNAEYHRYKLEYVLRMKNANPIVQLFQPDIYISENTEVEGSFTGGYTAILSANTTIDTLQYKNNFFYQLEAELNTSKIADSTNVLAMAYVQSAEQYFDGISPTENLIIEAIWDGNYIDLSGDIRQLNRENFADLNAGVYFLDDRTEIRFGPSMLSILDNTWQISRNNRIVFEGGEIKVEDLEIKDENQSLMAQGVISDSTAKKLNLAIKNFQLANLNPILEQKLSGSVNGDATLQNLLATPMINGALSIDDFKIDKFLVGDLVLNAGWDRLQEHLDLKLNGLRNGVEIVSAEGYYNPFLDENNLNIDAIFYKTNLNIIEPFIDEIFTNFKGTASGKVLITGTPRFPILRGGGSVNDGHIRINYLNTEYDFEGGFILSENEIGFRDLNILDSEKNTASLNGGIFHDGFDNFIINMKAKLNGTKVLNTSHQENELYYGTAYAEGDLEVLGPVNNLQFIASARTAKGTKIFIPVDYGSEYQQQEYINFISRKDTTDQTFEIKENINLTGIKLDFDLEITPDAYCEIIFDIRSGDIIRGRGTGKLELQIDTQGDFTMFGDYEITKGAYNFTLFNVITKEFVIDPGSHIRWMGDPYGGIMDIRARYNQSASLLPILPRRSQDPTTQERRPYPVNVLMDLKGNLLTPEIDFDIDIIDYPSMFYTEVQAFKALLRSDEQYLNRQVFNLIVLRQFAADQNNGAMAQSALGFGSQTAISSISELLSNQFSALVTQLDENLEIDVDVSSSIDADAINTFQLRLSYTFMDGRLRITRDGSIVSRTQPNQNANNFIGDWTIEYMLTTDGQYRVKMYSRNNMNQLTNVYNSNNFTQGISFLQTKSFDSIEELFQKKKKQQQAPHLPIQDNNDEGLLSDDDLFIPIEQ